MIAGSKNRHYTGLLQLSLALDVGWDAGWICGCRAVHSFPLLLMVA